MFEVKIERDSNGNMQWRAIFGDMLDKNNDAESVHEIFNIVQAAMKLNGLSEEKNKNEAFIEYFVDRLEKARKNN